MINISLKIFTKEAKNIFRESVDELISGLLAPAECKRDSFSTIWSPTKASFWIKLDFFVDPGGRNPCDRLLSSCHWTPGAPVEECCIASYCLV